MSLTMQLLLSRAVEFNVNGDFKICNIDDDEFTSETSEKLKKVVLSYQCNFVVIAACLVCHSQGERSVKYIWSS